MFSRSQPPSEGTTPEGASDPAPAAGGEAARAFDQALSDLQPPGSPPSAPDVTTVAATATEHAETLRATRDAHQEAQAMLAMANDARKDASEQAERIVLEARDAAERTRQEVAGWAAAQRGKVDALAADLLESARRDADAIRAEALRTSMLEAEETARLYVAEAATNAETDASAIRAEARNVLHRATELSEEVAETIGDLTTTVFDLGARLEAARAAMEQLHDETGPAPDGEDDPEDAVGRDGSDDPDDTDDSDDTDGADGAGEGEPGEDSEQEAADVTEGEATGSDGSETEQASNLDAILDESRADRFQDEQRDRQLGSMFRRPGQRGE